MKQISVLLPTRGRRDCLRTSLVTLARQARCPQDIEILLAFDNDDGDTSQWFLDNVSPELDELGVSWTIYQYPRLGYLRLNEYVNSLARRAQGRWLMFWGDDAVMISEGWDDQIRAVPDFRVLRMPTHRSHPYAIFPIVPRAWFETLGHISAHQLTDSYVSQIAYILDIMHNIDVEVIHDRFDITGNNNDETYANRPMLEGNVNDPRDFNHRDWRVRRYQDADKLAEYMRAQGQDCTWWDRVRRREQDPWERMLSPEQDPNGQVMMIQ